MLLELVPQWVGSMLRNVRAGHAKLAIVQDGLVPVGAMINLSSPAFANGGRLPQRFTADGAGVSPPLVWLEAPVATASFALIVEDPDAPAANPLVHGLLWDIPACDRSLPEGSIAVDQSMSAGSGDIGRNSFFVQGWLPPDPPPGHGIHDYVFQIFALSDTAELGDSPGRSEFVRALQGKVLAAGMLVGTYSRGEVAPIVGGAVAGALA